ncbi:VOC family protein [Nocardia farcinica]|uniref:VOC domain-containing protein n=1 Tax=Nocardia farcinica (strain IFM 10152) TaxID=247156 RepID=Q5YXV0_NOCFA|nr:VOC family protein [Nocardia farcinica]MBF6255500.1 VOC family protein [Nocardia farcinica]MBF6538021.1 VOC family protein [Nocardia farcinica]BAD56991.1 hypothetical protein NFA_21450 [Nocardia farcinica IFM 10152]
MTTHISHISRAVLYVADQAASRAFYADQLGFDVLRDEEMFPGARWLELRPPGGTTALVLSAAAAFDKRPGEGAYLHFASTDIHATWEALRDKGVAVSEVRTAPWGRHLYATDPDGNEVLIAEQ